MMQRLASLPHLLAPFPLLSLLQHLLQLRASKLLQEDFLQIQGPFSTTRASVLDQTLLSLCDYPFRASLRNP